MNFSSIKLEKSQNQDTIKVKKSYTINSVQDTTLLSVSCILPENDGILLVSDLRDFRIKKFSNSGELISYTGLRGDSGESFFEGPDRLAFDHSSKKIAVSDFSTPYIKLFDSYFRYLTQVVAPSAVSGIDFDVSGKLIVATPPNIESRNSVIIFDLDYEIINAFNPTGLIGNQLLDLFAIRYSVATKTIIIMYYYKNLIQEYSLDGKLLNQFSIPAIPDFVPLSSQDNSTNEKLPVTDIFRDLAVDSKGYIYILLGGNTNNAGKQIYKIKNKVFSVINLQKKTRFIGVGDSGNIYCVENNRTEVSKYYESLKK